MSIQYTTGKHKAYRKETPGLRKETGQFLQSAPDQPSYVTYNECRPAATDTLVEQSFTMEAWMQTDM